jgi:hypothetical protein
VSTSAASRWADWRRPGVKPDAEPMFGVQVGWEPDRACPHRGRMPRHTKLVCMCCHDTGEVTDWLAYNHHRPALERDARPGWWNTAEVTKYDPDAPPPTDAPPCTIKFVPRGGKRTT